MASVKLVSQAEATGKVEALFEKIKESLGIDFVPARASSAGFARPKGDLPARNPHRNTDAISACDERHLSCSLASQGGSDMPVRSKRRTRSLVLAVVALLAAAAATLVVFAVDTEDSPRRGTATPAGGQPSAAMPDDRMTGAMPGDHMDAARTPARTENAAASATKPVSRTIAVELGEMYVKPNRSSITAGKVTFTVRNVGRIEHELIVAKVPLRMEAPGTPHHDGIGMTDHMVSGSKKKLTVRLKPGTYELFCNVPGHYAAGQTTRFRVRGA